MSIHDRDYMRDDQPARRASPQAQQSANVDKMLERLDLSNLPPVRRKSALGRALDWIRRMLGIKLRSG